MTTTSQLVCEAENGPTTHEASIIVLFSSFAIFRQIERYGLRLQCFPRNLGVREVVRFRECARMHVFGWVGCGVYVRGPARWRTLHRYASVPLTTQGLSLYRKTDLTTRRTQNDARTPHPRFINPDVTYIQRL